MPRNNYKSKTMKKLIQLLFVLMISSSYAQDIWEPVNVPDTIYPNTINAEYENIILTTSMGMSGNNYIIRSYDDGYTWEKLDLVVPHMVPFYSVRFSSSGTLFVGTRFSIYKSLDNGDSFDEVYSNYTEIPSFRIEFSSNEDIYSIGNSIVLRSIDNGITWDTLYLKNSITNFVDIDFGPNNEIYIVGTNYHEDDKSGFFRSLDNGTTWEHIGITDENLQSVQVNSSGTILVSGTGVGGVFSSNDQGVTWVKISEIEVDVMESFSNDRLIASKFVEDPKGCWLSDDWGHTWESLVDSVINPGVSQFSISPNGYVYCRSEPDLYNPYEHSLVKSATTLFDDEVFSSQSIINIYPNPAKNNLSIELVKNVSISKYTLYNKIGQKIISGKVINNNIDISKLSAGLYIIEFNVDDKSIVKKIIIE